jgi:essential nuclear protein 1
MTTEEYEKRVQPAAAAQRQEMALEVAATKLKGNPWGAARSTRDYYDDDDDDDDGEKGEDEEADYDDAMVARSGDYVGGLGLDEEEEAVVQSFLTNDDNTGGRTLADVIQMKMVSKHIEEEEYTESGPSINPKVLEVYEAVGEMLKHYTAGKLPKALKMLPHLKNWEDILWVTRPDQWSPVATYACTRIFASNLNEKMAQRFYNLVLLEKCRDDIQKNNQLNYHYYMALKKALFKPAAFYKGLLLPLAQSQSCTLREAMIIGSVMSKVSIPGNHSAAALLRLASMPYSGSTSLFIKVLLNKKYALPRRVLAALVNHFYNFRNEKRQLPVLWHQALLTLAQRYKLEFDHEQLNKLKELLKAQIHHQITTEVRRELFASTAAV